MNNMHKGMNHVHPIIIDQSVNHKGKRPPVKFVSELNAQIKTASEEITRLKDFGTDADKPRIRELIEKRKQWKAEMLSQ